MTPSDELTVSLFCAAPDFHNHLRRAFGRSRVAPTRKAWARLPRRPRGVKFRRWSQDFGARRRMPSNGESEVVPGGIEPPLPT